MNNQTELKTASEVLVNSGIGFNVVSSNVYDGQGKQLEDYKAIQREDTGHTFQVSKQGYTIIKNSEALSVLDEVVGSGMAKYSGAKAFKNGAVCFIRADVPQLETSIAGDEIKAYLYAVTSHDGSIANMLFAHQQRLICRNLLTSGGIASQFKFKHTANYRLKIQDAIEVFAKYRVIFNKQKEAFEAMARIQFNSLKLDSFLNELLGIVDSEENSTRVLNQKRELERLFVDGIGHEKIAGTAWAAYNAVTQYVDHERGTENNREFSSIFGSGANLRDKAFALLAR